MWRVRSLLVASGLVLFLGLPHPARADLSQEQLSLLHDPGGWEFLAVFDKDNGVSMQHQCFAEGEPKPSECNGTLILKSDDTFSESIFMHGFTARRHGTYKLDDDQLTLFDEFGNSDGPYTVQIDPKKQTMRYSTTQAGVTLGASFVLVRKYKKEREKQKKQSSQ
ncbi:MAG TPA: hypothetical protein VN633_23335 [Bryobacteraceae bacterium]|nr:hypothetical protein [Bryobacteraceae bacterium]